MLRYLRRLDEKIDRVERGVAEIRSDIRGLKDQNTAHLQMMVGLMQSLAAHDHGLEDLRRRVERLERGLDLADPRE